MVHSSLRILDALNVSARKKRIIEQISQLAGLSNAEVTITHSQEQILYHKLCYGLQGNESRDSNSHYSSHTLLYQVPEIKGYCFPNSLRILFVLTRHLWQFIYRFSAQADKQTILHPSYRVLCNDMKCLCGQCWQRSVQ